MIRKKNVATFDVPGAYLYAGLPKQKFTLLKFQGKFVEIMCGVNPEYCKHVRFEKGVKVLYMRVLKTLYGMIESALLWYECYITVLVDLGLTINPYDPCVANNIIDGIQYTIAWYVDDNKLLYKDPKVVTTILNKIEAKFPGLVITRGKEHTFLGIKFKFRDDQKVELDLVEYIKEAIDESSLCTDQEITSPHVTWLLKVNPKARKLDNKRKKTFHSIVQKLLWLAQRG